MPYAAFFERFPEVAAEETRSITVLGDDEHLPRGSYSFLELFCDEDGCDCRRVFINVVRTDQGTGAVRAPLATISFGWEPESFYRSWASFPLANDDLRELKGPALVRLTRQSRYAQVLLDLFGAFVDDDAYVARIVRHYQMYRAAIDTAATAKSKPVVRGGPKPERNAPCRCGSGKKFKRCCIETQ